MTTYFIDGIDREALGRALAEADKWGPDAGIPRAYACRDIITALGGPQMVRQLIDFAERNLQSIPTPEEIVGRGEL